MPIATGDVLEITFVMQLNDQAGLNVAHFRVGVTAFTGSDESNESTLGTSLNTVFSPLYRALMSSAATYRGVIVKRLLPTLGPTIPVPQLVQLPGDRPGDPLPRQIAGIFTKVSAAPGRHGRGRVYVPFPSESDNDGDTTPISSYLTNLNLLSQRFVGAFNYSTSITGESADLIGVILDRAAVTTTDTVAVINRDKWATQRRRGSYGKINAPPF